VADGPHEAAPEPVVDAALALAHETGRDELGLREAAALQVALEVVPPRRRVPDAEVLGVAAPEAALGEERARGLGARGEELLGEVLRRDAGGLDQPLATSGLLARALRAAGVLVAELDPDAVGEVLDGLDEREPVDLLDERDDVAALAAPEAVPAPDAGAHVERRRALVVERAQALERADARRLERDVRGDDLVDPCAVADGFHVLASDQACHEASLCAADGRRGGPGAGSVTRSRTRRARRATRRTGARRRRASSPSRARSPCRGGPGRSSRRPSRAPRGPGPGRPRGGRPRGARGGAAGPTWGSRP